jgi:hypothetical protein
MSPPLQRVIVNKRPLFTQRDTDARIVVINPHVIHMCIFYKQTQIEVPMTDQEKQQIECVHPDAPSEEPVFVHECTHCEGVKEQYKNHEVRPFREKRGQIPLRKKTYEEKAHRFETMIRERQESRTTIQEEEDIVESLNTIFASSAFQHVRENMPGGDDDVKVSNIQALVRIVASQFKDPLIVLEKNVRWLPHEEYDEEYSCDEPIQLHVREHDGVASRPIDDECM